jgi:hypothetical protein
MYQKRNAAKELRRGQQVQDRRGVQQQLFERSESPRRKDDALEAAWQKVRSYCRDTLHYGEIRIIIHDDAPVQIIEVEKKVRVL